MADHDELPRVPLPDLDATCARFLQWCRPLLDAEQFEQTRVATERFRNGEGPGLHAELVAYDQRPDVASWLDEFWRVRYLGRRDRIALNANFFFLFTTPPAARQLTQTRRAAELITAAVDYKIAIDTGVLPRPTLRGRPLSTVQNLHLFSATRIPGDPIDSLRAPHTEQWPGPSGERHVIVFCRGRIFALDVLDPLGRPYPPSAIDTALQTIVADERPAPHPVGHLTTMAREQWAHVRDHLRALGDNAGLLDLLERGLFCVCLDQTPVADAHDAADQLLAGDSGSRWFDKSFTFIIFPDGSAGINSEHCDLDGTTVTALVDSVLDPKPRAALRVADQSPSAPPPAVALAFTLDDDLRATVDRAGAEFAAYAHDCTSTIVEFGFGASVMKQRGVSPDGLMQMAVQLAHHRARSRVGATYESIAMRAYRNGRTEAMRVVTPQSVAFVETMATPGTTTSQRAEALRTAITAHVARARECQAGDAPEQHLWVLHMIAARRGDPDPALFSTPGWTLMRTDLLSTSSVPSPNVAVFGFGSTSPVCIGVGYGLQEHVLTAYLSAQRAIASDLSAFAGALRVAVPELLELLEPVNARAPGEGRSRANR